MRVLNTYISRHLFIYFTVAIGIGTFVMIGGSLARVFELLTKDFSIGSLALYILLKIPDLLCYTVPMAVLVAVLLLFNRLSAENEITALRASGVSLLQVITPVMLLSFVLCVICFVMQFWVAPEYNHRARWLLRDAGARNPMALLEEGVFNEMFRGYIIYIGKKDGDKIEDIHIYVLDPDTGLLERDVVADTGRIEVNDQDRRLTLILNDCTMLVASPEAPGDVSKYQRMVAKEFGYTFEYGRALLQKDITRRTGWLTLPQLFAQIQLAQEEGRSPSTYYTELNMRAAMALAPFSFVVLAIPLGLRIGRRETSAGLVAGAGIALLYFSLMMAVHSFGNNLRYHPELLAWVPNIAYQAWGLLSLWRKR